MQSDPDKQKAWQQRGAEKYAAKRREKALAGDSARKAPVGRSARPRRPQGPSPEELEGRALVEARDAGTCVLCGKPGEGLNWHHRKLRSQGGDWSASNGILLCGSGSVGCHGRVHGNPREAYDYGWMVPGGRDPAEYPVLSWRWLSGTPDRHGVRRRGHLWLLLADDGTYAVIGDTEALARIDGEPWGPAVRPTQEEL